MKRIALILVAASLATSASAASWQETYSALLKKYVTPSGVRYAQWHANPEDLQKMADVTAAIARTSPPSGGDAQLAFYVNAYNAWILRHILADYPTDGPGGGGFFGRRGFFGDDKIVVAGKKLSFNDLEHNVIREKFDRPGVHFALNCASRSCPPLMDHAFAASDLDEDFKRLADAYINDNPEGIRKRGNDYAVSSIFKWYKEDFERAAGSVREYINRFRDQPIPAGADIHYLDYDWSLNAAR